MKKTIIILTIISGLLYSCNPSYTCPTYMDKSIYKNDSLSCDNNIKIDTNRYEFN